MKSVLVVSKSKDAICAIESCFGVNANITLADDVQAAMALLQNRYYDYIFIDITMLKGPVRDNNYKAALQPFWRLYPSIEIIVMTPQDMIREAVKAVKAGATEYLSYPITPEEVRYVVDSIREFALVQSELDYFRDQFWSLDDLDVVQTKSVLMRSVFDKVRSVAQTKSTVLLIGETGVGKGVLANLIHRHSNRKNKQFISVHCGAIPDTLLESEVFGHEKGAFTGAVRRKLGKFEIAQGGTIFLDEIATITPSAQVKLLQVLQDGIFQRVGGEETIKADVRVIAATNADLKKMCKNGQFRKDLFYRLNVFPIEIPALSKRLEDIPHLVELFLAQMNRENNKRIRDVDPRVLDAFKCYSWQGNIRELENLIERAYILETSSVLTPESFPSELFEFGTSSATVPLDSGMTLADVRKRAIKNVERNYLKQLLASHKGRIKDSASGAGVTTRQLHKLMKKHNLQKEEFK